MSCTKNRTASWPEIQGFYQPTAIAKKTFTVSVAVHSGIPFQNSLALVQKASPADPLLILLKIQENRVDLPSYTLEAFFSSLAISE